MMQDKRVRGVLSQNLSGSLPYDLDLDSIWSLIFQICGSVFIEK